MYYDNDNDFIISTIENSKKITAKENIRNVTIPNNKTFVPPHKQKGNKIRHKK